MPGIGDVYREVKPERQAGVMKQSHLQGAR